MEWRDFLPVFWAFLGCGGFAVVLNIYGGGIFICALGGAIGCFASLLSAPFLQNDITQTFLAAIVVSIFSEIMARVRKCPVTGYLLVSIFPQVPGSGIYYTMEYAMRGEIDLFLASFLHTLGLAGAIAVGVLLVSSAVRMWHSLRHQSFIPGKENRS